MPFLTRVDVRTRIYSWGMLSALAISLVLSLVSVGWKALCTGPSFDGTGSTSLEIQRYGTLFCYSDQRALWAARQLFHHVFPYQGEYTADGQLTGGVVEYPVLSGFFLWIVGLPADSDRAFVISAGLALTLAAVATTFLLYCLAGRRAFLWAAAPALAMYVAYNVDVLPVLTSVAGVAAILLPSKLSTTARAYLAAVLFGVGGALKIYPLMFALPVALWVAYRRDASGRLRFARWHFVGVLAAAAGTMIAANLPFAIFQTEGWLASFEFQSARRVENNTMAIWWWVPHLFGYDVSSRTALMTAVAGLATAAAFVVAIVWGWRTARRDGAYPWLPVSGALLAAFMVLGKVNSPQYILWLIPFLILCQTRVIWILAYYVLDLVMFYGIWRPFYLVPEGLPVADVDVITQIAVIARAAIIAFFYCDFLRRASGGTAKPADTGRSIDRETSGATVNGGVVDNDLGAPQGAQSDATQARDRTQ